VRDTNVQCHGHRLVSLCLWLAISSLTHRAFYGILTHRPFALLSMTSHLRHQPPPTATNNKHHTHNTRSQEP
jgi:hypothetical protein